MAKKMRRTGGGAPRTQEVEISVPLFSLAGKTLIGQKGKYSLSSRNPRIGGEAHIYEATQNGQTLIAKIYGVGSNREAAMSSYRERRERVLKFLTGLPDNSNIMPVLDYGEYSSQEDGEPLTLIFDILPFYPGGHLLFQNEPIDFKTLKTVIIPGINEGLKEIHEEGIIHRDIKPSNLYLHEKRVMIADLGIASIIDRKSGVALTDQGRGTMGYRAPEVSSGRAAFPASDYYSFGYTLASLFLGEEYFKGDENFVDAARGLVDLGDNAPPRLEQLISGLVSPDPERRFKYDQVKRWLDGEDLQVPRYVEDGRFFAPYNFEGNKYQEMESLSEALAKWWTTAKEHLWRGLLEDFFRKEGNQDLALQAARITEEHTVKAEHDLGLFKLLWHMWPQGALPWRGTSYNNLNAIAQEAIIDGAYNKDIFALLRSGGLSWRLKQQQRDNEAEEIKLIEARAQQTGEEQLTCYWFKFACSDDKPSFEYQDKQITNVDQLFTSVFLALPPNYSQWLDMFNEDKLCGFLCALGYSEYIAELRKEMQQPKDKQKSKRALIKNIFALLEKGSTSQKKKVRDLFLNYGPDAYLYWWKNNLGLYSFTTSKAKNLKNTIEAVKINMEMELPDIDKSFRQLESYLIDEFLGMFQDNIFLTVLGQHGGSEIVGKKPAAFFYGDDDFFGEQVPLGYSEFISENAEG